MERYADHLFGQVDDLMTRARVLRTQALHLEAEREMLLQLVQKLSSSAEIQHCSEVDRADILASAEHTRDIVGSIKIDVQNLRDAAQTEALNEANRHITALETQIDNALKFGLSVPVSDVRASFEAASGGDTAALTDSRFQAVVLGCTLEDQKIIRVRLQNLLSHAEETARRVASLPIEESTARRAMYEAQRKPQETVAESSEDSGIDHGVGTEGEVPSAKTKVEAVVSKELPPATTNASKTYVAMSDADAVVAAADEAKLQKGQPHKRKHRHGHGKQPTVADPEKASAPPPAPPPSVAERIGAVRAAVNAAGNSKAQQPTFYDAFGEGFSGPFSSPYFGMNRRGYW